MRALGFAELDDGRQTMDDGQRSIVNGQWSELWALPATEHPFPLPTLSRTEPHLAVKPHKAMGNALEKSIANLEEIQPRRQKSELPLVAFTLLAQMSVGMAWAGLWMMDTIPLIPYLLIGVCLAIGGFFSFAHLGAKRNAWRAPFHLKKSWLSREILTAGLFGASWLAGMFVPEIKWVTAFFGAVFVYSMAKVYRLHVMPAWDTWRTQAGFFITAALLGQSAMNILLGRGKFAWGLVAVLLAVELAMILLAKVNVRWTVSRLRGGLIAVAIVGAGILSVASSLLGGWISPVLFLLIMMEEIIGRVSFYDALHERVI
jgi:DMSO reductase anchor subunit